MSLSNVVTITDMPIVGQSLPLAYNTSLPPIPPRNSIHVLTTTDESTSKPTLHPIKVSNERIQNHISVNHTSIGLNCLQECYSPVSHSFFDLSRHNVRSQLQPRLSSLEYTALPAFLYVPASSLERIPTSPSLSHESVPVQLAPRRVPAPRHVPPIPKPRTSILAQGSSTNQENHNNSYYEFNHKKEDQIYEEISASCNADSEGKQVLFAADAHVPVGVHPMVMSEVHPTMRAVDGRRRTEEIKQEETVAITDREELCRSHIKVYDDVNCKPPIPARNNTSDYESTNIHQPAIQLDRVSDWDTESSASNPCSWLADEPLYQLCGSDYYDLSLKDWKKPHKSEDSVTENMAFNKPLTGQLIYAQARRSKRRLWCELDSVIQSNILGGLSDRERDLHETKFEIFTTEVSYLSSLTILNKHFIRSLEFKNEKILSRQDKNALFGYIKPLKMCSKRFLVDLENCWQNSIFLQGIFEVIYEHAKKNFDIFITYCSYLHDTQEKLSLLSVEKNFALALERLERSEACSKLPLHTFLTLPMERITRLALLITKARNCLTKTDRNYKSKEFDKEYGSCLLALDFVEQVCRKSDHALQRNKRFMLMIKLQSKLMFPPTMDQVSLISERRWLVLHCDVTVHKWGWIGNGSRTVSRKNSILKRNSSVLKLFLMNDLIILAKKKGDDVYMVKDYCYRVHATLVSPNVSSFLQSKLMTNTDRQFKMLLTMTQNHEKKSLEMVLSCATESERDLLVKTVSQHEDKAYVYTAVSFTHMVCVHPFTASEANHLSLQVGDEVVVTNTSDHGWMEGVRKIDRRSGIFPSSRVKKATKHTKEDYNYYEVFNV